MILPDMNEVQVLQEALRDLPSVERKMQRTKELLRRKHVKGDRKARSSAHARGRGIRENRVMVALRTFAKLRTRTQKDEDKNEPS